jgi:hypothetical protein
VNVDKLDFMTLMGNALESLSRDEGGGRTFSSSVTKGLNPRLNVVVYDADGRLECGFYVSRNDIVKVEAEE